MSRFPYLFFDNFVVRTPLLSYKDFQNTFCEKNTNDEKIKKIYSENSFREAIYLASPSLLQEIEKWLLGKALSPSNQDKFKNTILKYYSRISTRCTPFGLFASVGLGNFDSIQSDKPKTNIYTHIRDTKLDMHFLVTLSQNLAELSEIKQHLLYFPNNSIYRIGSKIRYVEYQNKDGKRDYNISSALLSYELEQILNLSKKGKTISQIADILINEDINSEEATDFVNELIENQVLVSELEPTVVGVDFLDSIISVLKRINAEKKAYTLISIQKKLDELDKTIGNPVSKYTQIEELIKSLGVNYDQKYLFQTDLYFNDTTNLPHFWKKELKKGMSFLNKITLPNKNTYLEKFKKAFLERFENEEISVSFALDTETGIGYRQDIQNKDIHPYLEDLLLPASKEKQGLDIKLNAIQIILNQKIQKAILEQESLIQLTNADFKDFEENWSDLPETMSFMTEIISENNQEKLYLNGGSGNAGRLLGRFCSEKSNIKDLVKKISEKEEELNNDKILAEIIHLPEARIGNILRRPTLRNYEIPYLGKSSLPEENKITLDDLYVSIKGDRILLRSKKLNKEVIPYLTNAHNYSENSLPIYHFLCDLSAQNLRFGLYFDWGGLEQIYNFLPRVQYGNTILSKAQWRLNLDEISKLISLLKSKEKIHHEIKLWREKHRLPKWIQWVKDDNTLTINLENEDLLLMFISSIKNEKKVIIEEFLYHEKSDFTNQFIFSMYKNV